MFPAQLAGLFQLQVTETQPASAKGECAHVTKVRSETGPGSDRKQGRDALRTSPFDPSTYI